MSSFNINSFSNHVSQTGYLSPNRFNMELTTPRVLQGVSPWNSVDFMKKIQFRGESSEIPGVTLDTQSVNRFGIGPRQKFAAGVNFTDIGLTFIEDGGNNIWKFFAAWLNQIFDFNGFANGVSSRTRYTGEYMDNYAADLKIFVYNRSGALVTSIGVKDAFPIDLGDISLNWSESGTVMSVKVRLAYREWFISGLTEASPFVSNTQVASGIAELVPTVVTPQ